MKSLSPQSSAWQYALPITSRGDSVLIGAHVSVQGGLQEGPLRAAAYGCECFQIFSRNQRQWATRPLSREQIQRFRKAWRESGDLPALIHDIYLVNLSSPDEAVRAKSCQAVLEELHRAESLGVRWVVIHPGSHRGAGEKAGLAACAHSLSWTLRKSAKLNAGILIETTAGQGNDIGHRFEHITYLLDKVLASERLAVCVDTCHMFVAGSDLKSKDGYEAVWREFDSMIGLSRLRAFHINDSIRERGSRVDRHTFIGEGQIGKTAFRRLLRDERFTNLPGIMEIPRSDEEFLRIIAQVKKLRGARKTASN
jgi:deoxyribonuclease-4